jgi:hypothetical protein
MFFYEDEYREFCEFISRLESSLNDTKRTKENMVRNSRQKFWGA